LQRLILPHPIAVQLLNGFYAIVHVPALILFLLWLYFRHRDRYGYWRNVGALLTLGSMLIQMIPVAPPRLLPQLGFTDTAMRYRESVYAPGGLGSATQLGAMPSVHVAWAVFIAVAVICVSTSRWRWLVLVHPAVTAFAVVATANHWWLDGIVGAALLPVALGLEAGLSRTRSAVRIRFPAQLVPRGTTGSATPDLAAASMVAANWESRARAEARSSSTATRADGPMP